VKIGSLCTGYGGLDLAVETHFNAETIWCAEFDKYASQVIEQRFDIPNYGDIKSINWNEIEPIDILTAGYPCQPFSTAGSRKGTEDARHIWPYIKEAISILRPRYVILENVRGHLSLGFKEVLKGLAEIGYDARWQIVRASDAGAAHQRARLFIVAYPNSYARQEPRRTDREVFGASSEIINGSNWHFDRIGSKNGVASATIPTNTSSPRFSQIIMDKFYKTNHRTRGGIALDGEPFSGIWWRDTAYEAAIERWQAIQGEPPSPLMGERLNPKFVEWMMGLPNGWVTECGLSVTQQLKMLGNGVVPQQAKLALELLTNG
jgi:DNA (cytosine-5)-methyltransferase 1